ncbi:hypothetical protein GCM10009677_60560 [Sphaerisporangium rubeum]|uniref:Uncharacterized protein n=1 Tax=Sphaerisporangium rubeum TaxID=321317 RepID=A0A7X0IG92_9ACTN|nr:hypothetical protein [Sphaerisporangium rubeum]MBB6474398.1 hypothetical protein [Sphaerisporangium rubeum]
MKDRDEATAFGRESDFDRLGNDGDAANPVTAEEDGRVREEAGRVNDPDGIGPDGRVDDPDGIGPDGRVDDVDGIGPDDKPGQVHRPGHDSDVLVAGTTAGTGLDADPEHGPGEADAAERDRPADLADYPDPSEHPRPGDLSAPAAEIPEPVTAEPVLAGHGDVPDVVPPASPAGTGDGVDFRQRWREVQASFVDDPRDAVRQADELVDEVFDRVVKRKQELTDRWKDADQGDTERLRVTLREYRSLLDDLAEIADHPAGSDSRPARHLAR